MRPVLGDSDVRDVGFNDWQRGRISERFGMIRQWEGKGEGEEVVGWHTGSVRVLLVEAALDYATLLLLKLLGPAHVAAVARTGAGAGASAWPRGLHWCLCLVTSYGGVREGNSAIIGRHEVVRGASSTTIYLHGDNQI